ncbi:hypothetical protein GCM10018980_18350 [Streptomyces capoamus]|uniref:Peptidase inhibitor family I36 n=1 Tax=Streptomyces capoamus TaxID=68183 RepID=A0A919EV13_9ACTN|nr:peptidase inhibitor family I36 protein [Streptomyces capoamus]GGW16300.1 hypothetical protein GCM10010501_31970 [Streptomyces libani subsp. rufus]GHG42522.1 hypothetical protein GCM10018980_18350 [Streptomyces capoamus]
MRHLATTAAGIMSALLMAGAGAVTPAFAADAPSVRATGSGQGIDDCPRNYYCLYDYRGFNIRHPEGQIWFFKNSVNDLGTAGAGDRASSVVNNLDVPIYLHRHFPTWADSGTCLEVRPHTYVYDLGLYTLDNEVSSVTLDEYPCY